MFWISLFPVLTMEEEENKSFKNEDALEGKKPIASVSKVWPDKL